MSHVCVPDAVQHERTAGQKSTHMHRRARVVRR
jgi:hypothetical protein